MIRAAHLTKRFPRHVAVNDVSFEVSRGEIVGFLGPNGAGKTTTMRMLTGYLPATGGDVAVAGRDVFTESREVRKRIGYLPESCPLYPDMRVQEYLRYRGRLKGLNGKRLRKRVAAVLDQCSLGDVQRRIIGQLSKGYRQRVGLADALVHEPELLILDEPTIGLDPNQIRHVRDLIRDLANEHTILLSTHILPEVEMTCQRVLIINKGRIIASDSPATLRARMEGGGQVVADIRGPEDQVRDGLAGLSGAVAVDLENRNDWLLCRVDCEEGTDLRADLFNLAATRGWALRELRMEHTSLEEVFVSLTKKGAQPS